MLVFNTYNRCLIYFYDVFGDYDDVHRSSLFTIIVTVTQQLITIMFKFFLTLEIFFQII